VPVQISGTAGPNAYPIVGPNDAITSLTLKPVGGLKFGTDYVLGVAGTIHDTSTPPQAMGASYYSHFRTFTPESLYRASNDAPASIGLYVQGDRAYLLQPMDGLRTGRLKAYDISKPQEPRFLTERVVEGRPISVSG